MKKILTALFALLFALVQSSGGTYIRFFGVLPNIVICYVICYSLINDTFRAGTVGLFCGLLIDATSKGAFGVNALIMMYFSIIISGLSGKFYWDSKLASAVAVFVCTIFFESVMLVISIFIDSQIPFFYSFIRYLILEGLVNFILSFAMIYLVRWLSSEYVRGI